MISVFSTATDRPHFGKIWSPLLIQSRQFIDLRKFKMIHYICKEVYGLPWLSTNPKSNRSVFRHCSNILSLFHYTGSSYSLEIVILSIFRHYSNILSLFHYTGSSYSLEIVIISIFRHYSNILSVFHYTGSSYIVIYVIYPFLETVAIFFPFSTIIDPVTALK